MTALKLIADEEGFRNKPYKCSEGVLTFGHGLTYITESESLDILQNRVYQITNDLGDKYDWFNNLTDNRQSIIVSMVYQLGLNGFSKFKKAILAIEKEDWSKACEEFKDSRAYSQTKNRWDRQIKAFYKG